MNQGEKLHKYLKIKYKSQEEILKYSRFSKSKLYGIFKQNEISKNDREIIIEDYNLEIDFFNANNTISIEGKNFEKMYYELLKTHNETLIELNECRLSQIELMNKILNNRN